MPAHDVLQHRRLVIGRADPDLHLAFQLDQLGSQVGAMFIEEPAADLVGAGHDHAEAHREDRPAFHGQVEHASVHQDLLAAQPDPVGAELETSAAASSPARRRTGAPAMPRPRGAVAVASTIP